MKLKKMVLIIILAAITLLSVNYLIGASTVTVTSKGKAWAKVDHGVATFGCDNSDSVTCTITIQEQ
jgi:hypothetical protein